MAKRREQDKNSKKNEGKKELGVIKVWKELFFTRLAHSTTLGI